MNPVIGGFCSATAVIGAIAVFGGKVFEGKAGCYTFLILWAIFTLALIAD